ncbi:hypothetical protein conserved [Leishmania donovani]|uniref:Hypothetical_protein_conserved n=1 Tax=Leishmania donovani TaxID=5661 RepID=A0A504X900_LEIDO|nr:hypothetical protein CGC20_31765 [Leishmania donovani]CAJ1988353.1 hypothetical protein conserved [Leishmania donovani]VDZ44237.1 hypothetical_protein_conserved [Leishmania donovani]
MDAAEGGGTHVIQLVSDDYFPSEIDEREPQQQLSGSSSRDGGASAQLGMTAASWRKLEAYIYSDAAVLDLRSHAWISIPSAEARRRRWRLVNCMHEQNPPISITITDLSSSVKPGKAPFPAASQEATADHQTAKAPPHVAAAPPPSVSSTPLPSSSPTASTSILATNASQHGAASPHVVRESESITEGGISRDVCMLRDGTVKAKDWHPPMIVPDSAGARNTTEWRLSDAPYLARGFTSDVFPLECRQLLEDFPMGSRAENWSMFVVAATLSFYQRQAHMWAASWWTWSAELAGSGGSLSSRWLAAPSTAAPANGSGLGMAGSVSSAAVDSTAADAAASAVLAPLVCVVYAVRILLLCVLYALQGLLRAGRLACARLLRLEASSTLPAKDSIMWTLATNKLWRLQVELMLASTAFILLVVYVLVLMRYRKYTQTLESWETAMARHTAGEAAKWAAQMNVRQRGVRTPTPAAVYAGESLHDSASSGSGGSTFQAPMKASSTPLSGQGSFQEESLEKTLRGASDSAAERQDQSFWYVDVKSEATEAAASSVSFPRRRPESSDSGTDDTLITQSSGEMPQGPFRGRGAAAAGGVDVAAGSTAMPSSLPASVASLTGSLSLPLVISEPLHGSGRGLCSSNGSGAVHAQRARSPWLSAVLESSNASDGPGDRTLPWRHATPLQASEGASSGSATPRRVEAAPRNRKFSRTAARAQPVPCVYSASTSVDQGASADDGHVIVTRALPAFFMDTSPAFVAAVTGDAVCLETSVEQGARASGNAGMNQDRKGEDGVEARRQSPQPACTPNGKALHLLPPRPTAAREDETGSATRTFHEGALAALASIETMMNSEDSYLLLSP